MFIFCPAAKNEPKKRAKGHCPLESRFRLRAMFRCAPPRLRNVSLAKTPPSWRHNRTAKMGVARGAMPFFWRTRRPHNKNGGSADKSVFANGKGKYPNLYTQRNQPETSLCTQARQSVSLPAQRHLGDSRRQDGSTSPNCTFSRRLCERSEQPKARTVRGEAARVSKGLALWCVFLLRSLPQGKE